MTPLPQLCDHNGASVLLARHLGTGGEGSVYDLANRSNYAAKIYHSTLPRDKVNKLQAMVALSLSRKDLPDIAAWPVATLHERLGGRMVGLIMPKIADGKEIHTLYSPAHRKMTFPHADWAFLIDTAINCTEAFEKIHLSGTVVGDVNQSSVFITPDGKAKLIDCDSFQFQYNGATFYCDVGVPIFTPPELQNQEFRGLVRTPNHDLFGLSILIFHLLFMGRHPFSGRYLGSGDMPIEAAIADGRYAFGRNAAQKLMQAPPHSVPIAVASHTISDLFEKAFSVGSQIHGRPSTSEWVNALRSLRRQLDECRNDVGHVFPKTLTDCPWCHLVRHGAPNYFISVAFTKIGGIAGVAFDLAGIWRHIESVQLPSLVYIRPPIQAVKPRPLPAEIPQIFPPRKKIAKSQNQLISFLGSIACTVLAIPLMFVITGLGIFFLVAAVGFGIWFAIDERDRQYRQRSIDDKREKKIAPLRAEIDRRKSKLRQSEIDLRGAEINWYAIKEKHGKTFSSKRLELQLRKADREKLARDYTQERQMLQEDSRAKQLEEYLQQQFISNAKIEGIGKAKIGALSYFSIDTAFDVSASSVRQVPGFGEVLTQRLVDWRTKVQAAFVFTQGMPDSIEKALQMKYYNLGQGVEIALRSGPAELTFIANACTSELSQQLAFIRSILARFAQASADVSMIPIELINRL